MIRRGIEGRHFSSLSAACGLGCVTASLVVLCWDPRISGLLLPPAALLLVHGLLHRSLGALLVLGCALRVGIAVQTDLASRWPLQFDGERVVADCEVLSIPQRTALGVTLQADCERRVPRGPDPSRPGHMTVQLHLPFGPADALPRAGERWRWLLELHPLQSRLNPGAIDAQRQWFRQRLHAIARLRPSGYTQRLGVAPPGLLRLRTAIVQALDQRVSDRDARALLAALAVGATGELTIVQWREFSATGTTHLIAISGMHVTAFAVVAALLARRGWRAWYRLRRGAGSSGVDCERFALCVSLAAATAYSAVAGFSVPTQRTLLMLAIVVWARLSSRHIGAGSLLSLAAIAVLMLDPYAPLAAGFWLSFIAVAVLIALGSLPLTLPRASANAAAAEEGLRRRWPAIGMRLSRSAFEGARLQTLLVLAMLPVTLMLFGSVPMAGLLMNLLAIPLFSFLMVPLTLAGMAVLPLSSAGFEASRPLWRLAEIIWLQAAPLFEQLAAWPLALWQPHVSLPWLVATPVLALAVLAPLPWRLRCMAAAVLAGPCVVGAQPRLDDGELQLTALDLGAGTSLLLQTRSHVMVIDTGDVHGSQGAAVARVVIPALRAAGLRRVDRLVLSEMSAARVTGATMLLQQMPVAAITAPAAWPSSPLPVEPCDRGHRWRWDGVQFHWLDAGAPALVAPDAMAPVVTACMLRVDTPRGSVLLPLSATALQQQHLLRKAQPLRAQFAVVPRHGALTALQPEFAQAVQPQWALALADRPVAAGVRRSWQQAGAEWLSTADDGAVVLRIGGSEGPRLQRPLDSFWRWPWRLVQAPR